MTICIVGRFVGTVDDVLSERRIKIGDSHYTASADFFRK